MKKVLLTLFALTLSLDVYADSCPERQIVESQEALKNTAYTLNYSSKYTDRNGNFQEGYMELFPKNLPSGYKMVVYLDGGYAELPNNDTYINVTGGVYKIEYYRTDCESPVKTFEMRVPYYKKYCGVSIKCSDNAWFDGTFENTASNQEKKPTNKVSTALVVILVLLIIIIVGFIAINIKRRHDSEKFNA